MPSGRKRGGARRPPPPAFEGTYAVNDDRIVFFLANTSACVEALAGASRFSMGQADFTQARDVYHVNVHLNFDVRMPERQSVSASLTRSGRSTSRALSARSMDHVLTRGLQTLLILAAAAVTTSAIGLF